MRRGWLIVGVSIIVLVAVHLAGRLPERAGRVQAQQLVRDTVARRNFGEAQQLASSLFDHVREEMGREHTPGVKGALAEIQSRRDVVIAALARTDPSVADPLEALETGLRTGLGYGVL